MSSFPEQLGSCLLGLVCFIGACQTKQPEPSKPLPEVPVVVVPEPPPPEPVAEPEPAVEEPKVEEPKPEELALPEPDPAVEEVVKVQPVQANCTNCAPAVRRVYSAPVYRPVRRGLFGRFR